MDSKDGSDAAKGPGDAPRRSSHPPPSTSKRIPQKQVRMEAMDAKTLARHRAAQQAALSAAKLGGTKAKKGRRGKHIALAMGAGVVLGLAGVSVYWNAVQAEVAREPAPRAEAAPPATNSAPSPPSEAPTPPPAPVASVDEGQGGAAGEEGSAPAEPAGAKVIVRPPTAGVLVNGKRVELVDGSFVLEGDVGTKHNVVMTVGTRSRPFSVEITAEGPKPAVLDLIAGLPATAAAAPPPVAPPATAPPVPAPPPAAPAPVPDDLYD